MQCLHFLMFAMLSTCFVLWLSWSNCYCFVTWAFFHPGFSFLYVLVFCFDIVGNLVAANTVIIGCSFYWSKGLIYPLSKKKKEYPFKFLENKVWRLAYSIIWNKMNLEISQSFQEFKMWILGALISSTLAYLRFF